ncbi:MAG: hypothetical protein M1833_006873 [Piccolia ochrophora]|nr:MAG: hypothetical protein M1833_006873 [Piccolia ochrophora]
MATEPNPRNRKERRQAAKTLKLAQPDRSGPKGKTLLDLAEERRSQLEGGTPFEKDVPEEDDPIEDPIGPFGEAVFFSISLTMLHFTLDVLVHNQYKQDFDWRLIVRRTATTFPILLGLVYTLRPRNKSKPLVLQLFFLLLSAVSGCYLIYASNDEPYFAVMKRAPPLGTLWVWSVIELQLVYAIFSLLLPLAFLYYGDYKVF